MTPAVLAFPYAGGGRSAYARLSALHGPSRWHTEHVMRDPLPADAGTVLERAESAAASFAATVDEPLVLFGHSAGAVVAVGLGARLIASGRVGVAAVVVSAAAAPDHHHGISGRFRQNPAAAIPRAGATAAWQAAVARAGHELDLLGGVALLPGALGATPIVAVQAEDDELVGPHEMLGWAACGTGPFIHRRLPGGHFYFRDRATETLACFAELPTLDSGRT